MQDLNASKKGDLATGDYTCHWIADYNFHPFSADSDWTQGLWQQFPRNFSSSFKYILNQKGFRLSLLMTEDNTQDGLWSLHHH